LRQVGLEISPTIKQNLKRIENLPWLNRTAVIDFLDNPGQSAVVNLALTAGIPRSLAFSTLKYLLLNGKPGGRHAASKALADFHGSDANSLALGALNDPDPQVQANILSHIRQRAIPGLLPRLVKFMDSPHLEVRRAVQQSLAEFSFVRFVGSFDMLDEEVQRTTGALVKKVDSQSLPLLKEELRASGRSRRIRGMRIAHALEFVEQVEPEIIELLHDSDADVRAEAAILLGECRSATSYRALLDASHDDEAKVQKAVEKSLAGHPLHGTAAKG
jgi:hypothetical protein